MTLASVGPISAAGKPFSDEQALVNGARRLEAEAWDALFREHYDPIRRYLVLRTGNPELSDDLASEVFLEAVRCIGKYRYRGVPFRAWLYRIAHNLLVNHMRRRERPSVPVEDADILDDATDHANDVVEQQVLHQALARLPATHQQVLALRFFVGLSLEETATVMGKNANAIKQLQHRALARLRTALEEAN